jgi:hypothetical protein
MKIILTEENYKQLREAVQEFLDELLIEYKELSTQGEFHYSADYTINNIKRIVLNDILRQNGKKIISVNVEMDREILFDEDVMDDLYDEIKKRWGGVEVEIKIKNRK